MSASVFTLPTYRSSDTVTAPAITGILDDAGTQQGALAVSFDLAAPAYTDDNRPDLLGMAVPGTVVDIYEVFPNYYTPRLVGQATAGDDWRWNLPIDSPLTHGEHHFAALVAGSSPSQLPSHGSTGSVYVTATLTPVITQVIDTSLTGSGGTSVASIADGARMGSTTPGLVGTAEPGATVTVLDNGAPLDGVLVRSGWGWGFVPTQPLDNAHTHVFTAESHQTYGTGPAASSGTYTVGIGVDPAPTALPPLPPVITQVSDDSGRVQGDVPDFGQSDDTRLTLAGTSEPGSRVQVFDNGTKVGEVITGQDWQWQFTADTPASAGLHTFSATATRADGSGGSTVTPYSRTVDIGTDASIAAPVILNFLPDAHNPSARVSVHSGSTSFYNPRTGIEGVAEAGSRIEILLKSGGQTATRSLGETVTDASGHWVFFPDAPLPVLDGTLVAQATRADGSSSSVSAGNGPWLSIQSLPDIALPDTPLAPLITAVQGDDTGTGHTPELRPTVSGTAEPYSQIEVYDNGVLLGKTATLNGWDWHFTPTQPLDTTVRHSFTVAATRAMGVVDGAPRTESASALEVQIDAPAAAPTITHVIDNTGATNVDLFSGSLTTDHHLTIQGTAVPNAEVSILDQGRPVTQVVADATGHWSTASDAIAVDGFAHVFSATASLPGGATTARTSADWTVFVGTEAASPVMHFSGTTPAITAQLASAGLMDERGITLEALMTKAGLSAGMVQAATELLSPHAAAPVAQAAYVSVQQQAQHDLAY